MPHDRREYVRTEAIPAWMAALAKQIIPTALIAAVGSSIVTWHLAASNADDVRDIKIQLEKFKEPGRRFTAQQGEQLSKRIDALEIWRVAHTAWGREAKGEYGSLHRQHERRLDRLETRLRKINRND